MNLIELALFLVLLVVVVSVLNALLWVTALPKLFTVLYIIRIGAVVAIEGYFFSRILGNWCVRNGSEKALCNTATLGFLNEISLVRGRVLHGLGRH